VAAREATGEEAELLWGRLTEQLPQTRNTRRIAQRDVPVWVLQPLTAETSA